MNAFRAFDEYLAAPRAGPDWSDDAVLIAGDLLKQFQADDWRAFRKEWPSRRERWQGFAADVLTDGPQKEAAPLLLEMICLGPASVKLVACDSLRAILQNSTKRLDVASDIKKIVTELSAETSGLLGVSLRQLDTYLVVVAD